MSEKKKKVKYIDDGRTIVDMSGVGYGRASGKENGGKKSTAREKWRTYWESVKLMFLPMLVVLGIITAAFLLMYLLLI